MSSKDPMRKRTQELHDILDRKDDSTDIAVLLFVKYLG